MQYNEVLEFIHGIARFGSKLGLERVSMLLERMGNPQDRLRFIHVAGTNGKGSTCAMLSHILVEAGYRTGLYISPYVLDFRERIQFDNEMIPEDELAASASLVKAHWDVLAAAGTPPTEFEVVLAIAMNYFTRMRCDIVVLEVGLGGRLDATNVIRTPLCSVITRIDMDHTEYLGETVAEIAAEKCGIIKPDGITVSYAHQYAEAAKIIAETCKSRNNRLFVAKQPVITNLDITGCNIQYGETDMHVPLAGAHQALNAATVVEVVKAVRMSGLTIEDAAIIAGISKTRFPARLEILHKEPLILLDGAHNPSGARVLAKALDLLKGRRIHAIVGVMGDKDVRGVLQEVLPLCASVTAVSPNIARAMPAERLAKLASDYCDTVFAGETIGTALTNPINLCVGEDVILIFGSLYLAAEIRPIVKALPSDQIRKPS